MPKGIPRNKRGPAERRRLSEWEMLQTLKEVVTLPVSSRGEGYCLYLPVDLVRIHGFLTGDRLTVRLMDHYRKIKEEEDERQGEDGKWKT